MIPISKRPEPDEWLNGGEVFYIEENSAALKLLQHQSAVAVRAVEALKKLLDSDGVAYDLNQDSEKEAREALRDIEASGWKP